MQFRESANLLRELNKRCMSTSFKSLDVFEVGLRENAIIAKTWEARLSSLMCLLFLCKFQINLWGLNSFLRLMDWPTEKSWHHFFITVDELKNLNVYIEIVSLKVESYIIDKNYCNFLKELTKLSLCNYDLRSNCETKEGIMWNNFKVWCKRLANHSVLNFWQILNWKPIKFADRFSIYKI